jgi:hypothetical protein
VITKTQWITLTRRGLQTFHFCFFSRWIMGGGGMFLEVHSLNLSTPTQVVSVTGAVLDVPGK